MFFNKTSVGQMYIGQMPGSQMSISQIFLTKCLFVKCLLSNISWLNVCWPNVCWPNVRWPNILGPNGLFAKCLSYIVTAIAASTKLDATTLSLTTFSICNRCHHAECRTHIFKLFVVMLKVTKTPKCVCQPNVFRLKDVSPFWRETHFSFRARSNPPTGEGQDQPRWSLESPSRSTWAKCYKTFYGRNLRVIVIS